MASSEENGDKVKIKRYLSENKNDLADVYAAHKKSLEACKEEISQWNKFIKDYNVLQSKLTTYPDKTTYDEVIPIGSLAYMKGQKIHTNEILVHLGENWFAERSVKDALAIIARRKEVCKEKLDCVERAKEIHEGWLKQTQELAEEGEKVEILEHISEEEYEKSKEKHREMVSRHLALMRNPETEEDPDIENTSISTEVKNFEDLLKWLDALEEEERVLDELTELGDEAVAGKGKEGETRASASKGDDEAVPTDSTWTSPGRDDKENSGSLAGKEKLRRRVSWADQLAERKHQDDEDDDEEEAEDKHSPTDTVRIKYRTRQQSLPAELISSSWDTENGREQRFVQKNSQTEEGAEGEGEEGTEEEGEEGTEEEEEADSELATPQSPSDLYKMFGPHAELSIGGQPTKGILKKKGDSFQGEETEKGVGWSDTAESITYIPSSPDEPVVLPRKLPLSESPKEIKNLKPAFSYKVVARESEEIALLSALPSDSCGVPPEDEEEEEEGKEEEPKRISRFKASRLKKEP